MVFVWTFQCSSGSLAADGQVFVATSTLFVPDRCSHVLNIFHQQASPPVKPELLASAAETFVPPFPGSLSSQPASSW